MAETTTKRALPGSLDINRNLSQWLDINTDGSVTMRPGKIEIGQGILTALRQIVAEELDVNLERVNIVTAVTALSPNEGVTSGSRSIEESGTAFRYAAAEARELLLARAGVKLGVSIEQLSVTDGVVSSRSGGSVTYWEITDGELLKREATGEAKPKSHMLHKIVGTAARRVDIPRKMTGAPVYVHDMDAPGQLHARVSRPPSYKAELVSVDLEDVRKMPGVVAVVRDGRFLGVVAEREEQAIRAARRLTRNAQWREAATLPEYDPRYLLKLAAKTDVISEKKGAPAAGKAFTGEYTRQFLAHASLAPSCAVATFDNGKFTVWTHSQGIYPLRAEMAPALGVPPEDIVIHHVEGAGCYGHNAADDVALEAALIARAVPGKTVRLQWMREEEFAWEPYSSAMVVKTRATLSDAGHITEWQMDVWSHGHSSRPGRGPGSNLLAAWYLEKPLTRAQTANPPLPGGGSHRNAIPIYDFPNEKVSNHLIPDPPLRASALRGLGSQTNVFAIESFMDELALAAGVDAVEFRLRHLKDPRGRAVIEKVAAMAKWQPGVPPKGDGAHGRGIGFARYKNGAGYMAMVVDIVLAETIRVTHVWGAVDVGQVINSDGLTNQIEGGIIQAVSFALKEEVKYDRERVTLQSWDDYPILSFAEVPEVEVALINRPELVPLGAGEGTQGPISAAIANAVFNAAGVRLRDIPFTRERLIAAAASA